MHNTYGTYACIGFTVHIYMIFLFIYLCCRLDLYITCQSRVTVRDVTTFLQNEVLAKLSDAELAQVKKDFRIDTLSDSTVHAMMHDLGCKWEVRFIITVYY